MQPSAFVRSFINHGSENSYILKHPITRCFLGFTRLR